MRVSGTKDTKTKGHSSSGSGPHQQTTQTNDTTSLAAGGQPLQARSSNSGTSVKRSDNISQSSYVLGDVSSDKPVASHTKTGTMGAD